MVLPEAFPKPSTVELVWQLWVQNMQGVSCALTYAITHELPSLQDVLKEVLDFVRNIVHGCDYTEENLQNKYGTRISNQKLLKQLQQSGMELLVAVTDWPVFFNYPDNRHKPDSVQNMLKTIVKKLTLPNERLRQVYTEGFYLASSWLRNLALLS